MISRLIGAVMRAIFMVILVSAPGMLLPGVSPDSTQFATLIALFVGALVLIEYSSKSPIMIEFRDAPPYNRLRFVALAAVVALLTILVEGAFLDHGVAPMIFGIGTMLGEAMNVGYSPVRLMILMLPDPSNATTVELMLAATGLSLTLMIMTVIGFWAYVRLLGWPRRNRAFNVHTNLPMFEPTLGGDVIERLKRGSRINMLFGCLLPFIIPACLQSSGRFIDPTHFDNPLTLVWLVALWAFLSASLCMRGIAMRHLVRLIQAARRQRYLEVQEDGLLA